MRLVSQHDDAVRSHSHDVRSALAIEVAHSDRRRMPACGKSEGGLEGSVTVTQHDAYIAGSPSDGIIGNHQVWLPVTVEVTHCNRCRFVSSGIEFSTGAKRSVAVTEQNTDRTWPTDLIGVGDNKIRYSVAIEVANSDAKRLFSDRIVDGGSKLARESCLL